MARGLAEAVGRSVCDQTEGNDGQREDRSPEPAELPRMTRGGGWRSSPTRAHSPDRGCRLRASAVVPLPIRDSGPLRFAWVGSAERTCKRGHGTRRLRRSLFWQAAGGARAATRAARDSAAGVSYRRKPSYVPSQVDRGSGLGADKRRIMLHEDDTAHCSDSWDPRPSGVAVRFVELRPRDS